MESFMKIQQYHKKILAFKFCQSDTVLMRNWTRPIVSRVHVGKVL